MANMSYCRCENTASDLQDVYDNVTDPEQLSDTEQRAFKRLLDTAVRLIEDFGYIVGATVSSDD